MRPIFLLVLILLPLGCLTAQKIDANAIKAASSYGFTENKGQVIDFWENATFRLTTGL